LTAVPSALHHSLDRFQMSDCPGQTIYNRLCVRMAVGMSMAVFMGMGMCNHGSVRKYMGMNLLFVLIAHRCSPPYFSSRFLTFIFSLTTPFYYNNLLYFCK